MSDKGKAARTALEKLKFDFVGGADPFELKIVEGPFENEVDEALYSLSQLQTENEVLRADYEEALHTIRELRFGDPDEEA